MQEIKYILTEQNLTLVLEGRPYIISREIDNFDLIINAARNNNISELISICKLDYNYQEISNILDDMRIRDILSYED